jgi:hypothetical protein
MPKRRMEKKRRKRRVGEKEGEEVKVRRTRRGGR